MRQKLKTEELAKFVELLGIPEDASHERIHQEMKRASEAQTLLIEGKVEGASRPQLVWMSKLLEQKIKQPGNAILFWEFFFDYDAEHKLGFMNTEMAKIFPNTQTP